MTTHSLQHHKISLNEHQAQPHLDLQQAQSELSLTSVVKLSGANPAIPSDCNNQTTLTIQTETKTDDYTNAKEDKLTNSNSVDQSQLVSIDKYNKLKRKFSVLRKVSNFVLITLTGVPRDSRWLGRFNQNARELN